MTDLTREELVALAYRFFPRGLTFDDPGYGRSSEYARYSEAWTSALADERWGRLQRELGKEFPETVVAGITVPRHDPAQRLAIYLDNLDRKDGFQNIIVGCVSVVAPCYYIYGAQRLFKAGHVVLPYHLFLDRLPDPMVSYARSAARQIERMYDYRPIPRECLPTPIPDISVSDVYLGEMTLLTALFTTGLDSIP